MNKKYLSIILSVILIFSIVLAISGCNKDDDTVIPNESTDVIDETEPNTEESSTEEIESTSSDKETEKPTENSTKPDESQTENQTKPTETTTDNDEPATCDKCGGIIVDNSDTDHPLIGNYCDGKCDEWFGD